MLDRTLRAHGAGLLSLCALAAAGPAPALAVDAPDPAWNPAASYYGGTVVNGVPLTGVALRTKLSSIVSTGIANVSYDQEKLSMPITDRVYGGAVGARMNGVYDRVSLIGQWDAAATWNREHVWPQSKLAANSDHDMFGLRPANVKTNGDRANYGYGGAFATVAANGASSGNLTKAGGAQFPQFFAGTADKGDVARACFYMATRYYVAGNPASVNSLKIVATPDGYNPDGTMGDLDAMLHWHYQDVPDNFERRRNQYIFKNPEQTSATGNLSQGNRNPYVDHSEYVWSVFGTHLANGTIVNDSRISVGAPDAAGASTKSVSFGRVVVGGAAPALTASVAITKTGADPTTYTVTTSGAATADGVDSAAAGRSNGYNAFDYNPAAKSLAVGLTASTATAGLKSGSVTLDNTDLTSAGAGSGSADGNDTVDLSLAVLDHANASFAAGSDSDTLILNFQDVDKNKTASMGFSLTNLLSASGYTAGLDLDSITAAGDTDAFGTDLGAFAALTAGTSADFDATFTPTHGGTFLATYTLGVSDENLSGATAGPSLTLILSGVASSRTVPEPACLTLAPLAIVMLRRRRA